MADRIGKGKHIRTVPMPSWVKRAVDVWVQAAGISTGSIFRAVSRNGAIWHVVQGAARHAGIGNLASHDLCRSCARPCHLAGGEREQIHFYSVTFRFRRPRGILVANRNCETQ